jgi:hypothetical protein
VFFLFVTVSLIFTKLQTEIKKTTIRPKGLQDQYFLNHLSRFSLQQLFSFLIIIEENST